MMHDLSWQIRIQSIKARMKICTGLFSFASEGIIIKSYITYIMSNRCVIKLKANTCTTKPTNNANNEHTHLVINHCVCDNNRIIYKPFDLNLVNNES